MRRLDKLFEIRNLEMFYPITRGFRKKIIGKVKAVNDVSFDIYSGETLGVVGESGCGKSTVGNCLIRLLRPTGGSILYTGKDGEQTELTGLPEKSLKWYRKEAQMVFQDPYSSLNPRMTVRDLIGEPLMVHKMAGKDEIAERVAEMLKRVGLRPEYMKRYPHAFSGGQRQRISIARALILRPRFVICDEAVSSLDVSVQAQIIELLQDLQAEFKNSYMFISHDLSVVKHISDRILVMYLGQVVEFCEAHELFENTLHPYTRALIEAVPKIDSLDRRVHVSVKGEVGDPSKDYPGCAFVSRCSKATARCSTECPALKRVGEGDGSHYVACHLYD